MVTVRMRYTSDHTVVVKASNWDADATNGLRVDHKLIIMVAYGIIGLNSKGSANNGFLKLSPILFSPQKRLMIDLRRKHAQNEDLSAKRSAACNSGSTVSDVVPSRLLKRQSAVVYFNNDHVALLFI